MTNKLEAPVTTYSINDETFIRAGYIQASQPIRVNIHDSDFRQEKGQDSYQPIPQVGEIVGRRKDDSFIIKEMEHVKTTNFDGDLLYTWKLLEDGFYKIKGFPLNSTKNFANNKVVWAVQGHVYLLTDLQALKLSKKQELPVEGSADLVSKANPLPNPPHPALFDLESDLA